MSASSKRTEHLQQSLPAYLVRTKNRDNEDCYFVLRTSSARYHRLIAKQKKEPVNISEYGEILISGYGRKPSTSARAKLMATYGVELPEDN